jgi:hypothetical protein
MEPRSGGIFIAWGASPRNREIQKNELRRSDRFLAAAIAAGSCDRGVIAWKNSG